MIRQWLKFNTSFVEILKNSSPPRQVDQRCVERKPLVESWHNVTDNSGKNETSSFKPVASASTSSLFRPIRFLTTLSDPKNRGDGQYSELSDEEETESAGVAETPAQTELFHVKGPDGSAFLIEVYEEDVQEVREELNRLKGEMFSFDKTIIERFTIKCILTAESSSKTDQLRLAKVHAISSGAEEFYQLDNSGQFLFINSVDRTMRAKRILERLGYTISGILYRFQPSRKIDLEDHLLQVCNRFVRAVERLPKVISITHNL